MCLISLSNHPSTGPIDYLGVEDEIACNFELTSLIHAAKKARAVSQVTRASLLVNLDQNGIGVAVDMHRRNRLDMAGGFPFAPQGPPRPRVKDSLSALECLAQSLVIHPGHHENIASRRILHDGGNQAVCIPFQSGQQRR
jgi:hypothetical protein